MTFMSCRLFIKEMSMEIVQDEAACVNMPIPCIPAITRSPGRSTPAAMRDDAPVPGMQSTIISRATREAGSTLYGLLSRAELMRVAYEKGELATFQSLLSLLRKEAADLTLSVSSIVELTKHEKNPTGTESERFDIVALLQDVSKAARAIVGDKPVTVMDVSCPNPFVIFSDPSMIRQIMMHLVSNAAKYTNRGRIALILSRDNDEIRLTVADTGRGMTQEQITSVQGSFDQGQDGEMNDLATSGVGLRLVKALVTQLHGSLSLASKAGEGTIVTVSLPVS
jgi:signal transduction histidine kinase